MSFLGRRSGTYNTARVTPAGGGRVGGGGWGHGRPPPLPRGRNNGFLFARFSLVKMLKTGLNESSAYPAELLLDGAESAQIFYDTPVIRFYIDPGSVSGRTRRFPFPKLSQLSSTSIWGHLKKKKKNGKKKQNKTQP